MSTTDLEKTKRKTFFTLLVRLFSLGVLLFVVFMLWSRTQLDIVLMDIIDSREISSMTFSEHTKKGTEEFIADTHSIDDFTAILESGELNNLSEPVYPPSYLPWDMNLRQRPFDAIQSDAHSVFMVFSNGETETLYFTWDELQVNDAYYTSEYRLPLDFWREFNDEILERIENGQQ